MLASEESEGMVNSIRLPKALELLQVYSKLFENSIKQRRADLTPSVHGHGRGPAILVTPPFVASGLSCAFEPELRGNSL